jgi:pimeloyl-ACP methyl ester carboxylesterase
MSASGFVPSLAGAARARSQFHPSLTILCLALFWLASHSLGAAELAIAEGRGQVEIEIGGTKTKIKVFTYRPAHYHDGPLIVVFHGLQRNAETYRDHAIVMGDRFNALIAAPLFETNRFPSAAYQRGGIMKKGELQPKEEWTYSLIPPLVDEIRKRAGRPEMPYYFIGHSAGGQFLVRLSALLPTGVQRVVAANPGSQLFPTRDLPFPYGFGGLPEELGGDSALKRFLAQPLTLFQGTADVLGENLDVSATAMKQGATRIERGRANFRAAQKLAQEKGWPFNWRLVEAPGEGHDAKGMFAHANCQEALFGPSTRTFTP